ncbi:MAG: 2'-5' RNA ligase family protein [Candidatus Woesearchaeota archaeon]|nr:2'-5' RNA ligase family protein [Candidatus Woesearchaeota archaeon]
MENYSITLNFFIQKEIVKKLKKVKLSRSITFDWRKSSLCHCTVKAIKHHSTVPEKIDLWVEQIKKNLLTQKPFMVTVKDIATFPKVIFARVSSPELIKLHKKLFKILPSSQPAFENTKYVPHVTLALLSSTCSMLPTKKYFGRFKVTELELMIWHKKNPLESEVYHRFSLTNNL